MSLRDPAYQSAIELGEAKTEAVCAWEFEREQLWKELTSLLRIKPNHRTLGTVSRIDVIKKRLARIEELLAK